MLPCSLGGDAVKVNRGYSADGVLINTQAANGGVGNGHRNSWTAWADWPATSATTASAPRASRPTRPVLAHRMIMKHPIENQTKGQQNGGPYPKAALLGRVRGHISLPEMRNRRGVVHVPHFCPVTKM